MKITKVFMTILSVLVLLSFAYSQPVAQLSYVTNKGKAYLVSQPEIKLVKGQDLASDDVIVLENGAGVRIFFLELNQSKKFRAPDRVVISDEIEILKTRRKPINRTEKARAEIGKFVRQYIKPIYNRYAGTRGAQIFKSPMIHDYIMTFRKQPHFIIRGTGEPQKIFIYSSTGDEIGTLTVPATEGILTVQIQEFQLDFGKTYNWKIAGEKHIGKISLVLEELAQEIEETIRSIETDALDKVEAAQSIAAYLFDRGFWTDAYVYASRGLLEDAENSVLSNLQQAIVSLRPEDAVFRESLEASEPLLLKYSFHIKKANYLQEIYTGSTVHSGDKMQIRLQASDDCYLFILNIDASNKLYVLYPIENQDHFFPGNREIVLPDSNMYYKADEQVGEEKLYLIASRFPLDHLANELDRYFTVVYPETDALSAMRRFMEMRGFSMIVDKKGETVHDFSKGQESFELTRILKGKGLVVKEIIFEHVK